MYTARVFYLVFIFIGYSYTAHAQLQCDKTTIHTTIGRDINVFCSYNYNQFVFSKKYWCFGESRSTCEVLMDTDGFTTTRLKKKAWIQEQRSKTFQILMTGLRLEDTGVYWAGIDKIYADIMFRINVVVTEEAVSRPHVWLDVLPVGTCHGQPVIVHCRSERGNNVKYSWSREAQTQDVLLQRSTDLLLHCAILTKDARYICSAQNAVSREQSKPISLHLLHAEQENCIYSLTSDELETYDCRTTTASPVISTKTSMEASSPPFVTQSGSGGNQSLFSTQTQNWNEIFSLRSWSGGPLWYEIVRWFLFVAMITTFGLVRSCTKNSRVLCEHYNETC